MPARGLLGHGPGPGGRAPAPAPHDETPTTAVTYLTALALREPRPQGVTTSHQTREPTSRPPPAHNRTCPNKFKTPPKPSKPNKNPRHGFTMTRV